MSDELSDIRTDLALTAQSLKTLSDLVNRHVVEYHQEHKEWWQWRREVDDDRLRMKTTLRLLGLLWVAGIAILGIMQHFLSWGAPHP